jgi:hypothetical protein
MRKPAYECGEAGEARRRLLTVAQTSGAASVTTIELGAMEVGDMMTTIQPLALAAGASLPRVCRPFVFTFQPGTTKPSG